MCQALDWTQETRGPTQWGLCSEVAAQALWQSASSGQSTHTAVDTSAAQLRCTAARFALAPLLGRHDPACFSQCNVSKS